MKILITILAVFLLSSSTIYAETTYEKKDDLTLKTITSTTTSDIKTYMFSELLTLKARKLEEIKNNQENYLTKDTVLKEELVKIEELITEANKLGVKETPEVIQ